MTTLCVTLVGEHLGFGTPVHPLGLPVVSAATGKAECLETHVFHGDITCQHHEICPGNLVAVFLLDGPKQASRLVEVAIIRPAVQRLEALLTTVCTAATVRSAIRASTVPSHANKEGAIVAVIRGPPWLRSGQGIVDIRLERFKIKPRKLCGIIEISIHGICTAFVLSQRRQVKAGWPPGLCALRRTARHRFHNRQCNQSCCQCGVRERRFH